MGRPANKQRQKFEQDLGVSARRIQQIIKEIGVDKIQDMAELKLWEKRIIIALKSLQARREEHDLDVAKRNFVPVAEVHTLGMKLGASVSELASSSISNWPAELSGRTEIQVRETLVRFWDEHVKQFRAAAKKI